MQKPDRIRRVLLRLDAAVAPREMDAQGFRFHALKGKDKVATRCGERKLSHHLRLEGEDAVDVDLEDYH